MTNIILNCITFIIAMISIVWTIILQRTTNDKNYKSIFIFLYLICVILMIMSSILIIQQLLIIQNI